ncbi:hypothetical protein CANARDRAFT_195113 [[Candida] arabinofermentans NRRL YB-2248]|uniref:F-box domain-containing protein n=1 Tax=[Candida] arabinofermentans NRRL YB-2248 TaxID=983967 RepID=A0A1E4T715_9ASCO|nr:hypothetical protein CANARDRAFT_195113 [[Candida] arabinofermentans NRRL YB-2248]
MHLCLRIPEILNIIGDELTQFDLLHLTLVCKLFNLQFTSLLYRSITIDYNYTQFDNEFNIYKTSYIRTKSNIKLLFNTRESNFNHIVCFKVDKLPLEFIDFEKCLIDKLPYFNNVKMLSLNTSTSLQILNNLPQRGRLIKSFNIHINLFGNKVITNSNDLQLESLCFGPFTDNINLNQWLLRLTGDKSNTLTSLKMIKQYKKLNLNDLLDGNLQSNVINFGRFPNLTKLSLINLIMKPNDLNKLKSIENQLQFLEFTNIYEISNDSSSILSSFKPLNLKILKIDITQSLIDHVPQFINNLPYNTLNELDITVRFNELKNLTLDEILIDYIESIKNQSQSLIKLSFEIICEVRMVQFQQPLNKSQFNQLFNDITYPLLKSLRFQLQFNELLSNKIQFFNSVPLISKLSIIGANSIERHWGLGTTYPGIFDSWLRIQHLPLQLINDDPKPSIHNLKYIKMNDCLFEIKNNDLIPRNTIDDWYDHETRVCF